MACGVDLDAILLSGKDRGSNWFEDEEREDTWFDGKGGGGADWDYGGGNSGSSSGGNGNSNNENVDVEIINNLTGKEKCLHDLLTDNGTNFVKDLLKNFEGDSEFDIKIMSKDKVLYTDKDGKKKEVNGKTSYEVGSKIVNIEINSNKINDLPALAAVRTILHEYIHADIYRKLYTKTPSQGYLDFKITYEQFEKENEHETMALLYVNSMKEVLKSFHEKVMIKDYNYLTDDGKNPLPDTFYEALAWQGLQNQNVKAYKDLKGLKKIELENSINLYYPSTTKNCPKN